MIHIIFRKNYKTNYLISNSINFARIEIFCSIEKSLWNYKEYNNLC